MECWFRLQARSSLSFICLLWLSTPSLRAFTLTLKMFILHQSFRSRASSRSEHDLNCKIRTCESVFLKSLDMLQFDGFVFINKCKNSILRNQNLSSKWFESQISCKWHFTEFPDLKLNQSCRAIATWGIFQKCFGPSRKFVISTMSVCKHFNQNTSKRSKIVILQKKC